MEPKKFDVICVSTSVRTAARSRFALPGPAETTREVEFEIAGTNQRFTMRWPSLGAIPTANARYEITVAPAAP